MFYLCIVYSCCVALSHGLHTVPLYARDFSEHCRRRDALPSVFLGRQVMEANAQVLHFSKLDLPYSCYASVRTQSAHNIIMVVQIDEPEQDFCNNGYQLAVYDFVETFGGYWGPLPEELVDSDPEAPVYTKQYTLQTKPPPVETQAAETYTTTVTTSSLPTKSKITAQTQDFIDIEVPIVNLSASLVPSEKQEPKAFDIDEFFDLFYDVAPRPGRPYDTSILPLVQIAVKKQKQDGRREGEADGEPKYELDYNVGPFTPDHRLTATMPDWPTKTNRNRNRWKKKKLQDKRVELKMNNSLNSREPATRKFFRKHYTLPTTYQRSSYKYATAEAITEKQYETRKDNEPFNLISDIMKSLNETGDLKIQEQSTDSGILAMLNTPENSHKLSAYLAPYPTFTFLPVSDEPVNSTKIRSQVFFSGSTENSLRISSQDEPLYTTINISLLEDNQSILYPSKDSLLQRPDEVQDVFITKDELISVKEIETSTFNVLLPQEEGVTEITQILPNTAATEPVTDDVSIPGTATKSASLSGTLVDHESWDNVVQSAPVMAGLLNQYGPEQENSSHMYTSDSTSERTKRRVRQKRYISAIAINEARPYRRATAREPRQTASRFGPVDVHEFARFMELPDDQMSNRVAMNIDASSSQSVLFNLCDSYDGIKPRYLLLFNSSRIMLSIANFSIPHIMVVLTAGRALAMDEQQCPETQIECQVLGTRICIDYSNTCDGIPNCGSSNAYDEDRVLCRRSGPQGNVYLAAATFLSVLVTAMYIAHYWLRRCVPNVADAFFVYADSADNELYLDSIMRSPMDTTSDGNLVFDSSLFNDEHIQNLYDTRMSTSIFKRVFSILPKLSLFKQRQTSAEGQELQVTRQGLPGEVPKKMYSFTEMEIRNMISAAKVDREAQTGESLEMAYLKMINAFKNDSPKPPDVKQRQASVHGIVLRDVLTGQRVSSSDTSSESPGPSGGSVDNYIRSELPVVGEEKELHTTFYEPGVLGNILKSETSKNKDAVPGRKCLRFNDRTMCIPREDDDDEPAETEEPTVTRRQSVVYRLPGRMGKRSHQKPDDEDSERGGSDFRKFFRKKKDRK